MALNDSTDYEARIASPELKSTSCQFYSQSSSPARRSFSFHNSPDPWRGAPSPDGQRAPRTARSLAPPQTGGWVTCSARSRCDCNSTPSPALLLQISDWSPWAFLLSTYLLSSSPSPPFLLSARLLRGTVVASGLPLILLVHRFPPNLHATGR